MGTILVEFWSFSHCHIKILLSSHKGFYINYFQFMNFISLVRTGRSYFYQFCRPTESCTAVYFIPSKMYFKDQEDWRASVLIWRWLKFYNDYLAKQSKISSRPSVEKFPHFIQLVLKMYCNCFRQVSRRHNTQNLWTVQNSKMAQDFY